MKKLVLALILLTLVSPARATGFQVINTNDSGSGSLRQLIITSPSGSVIDFATNLSGQTIRLTSGELNLSNSVSITAASLPSGIVVSGNNNSRIMVVTNSSTSITLSNLTLVNGNGASSIILNGQGAAILSQGIMALIGCTFASNNAGFGAIRNQGGGTMMMTNCTLSGNYSTNEGGAYFGSSSTVTMIHCTISSNNAATRGGGIRLASATAIVSNSIVAGNALAGSLTAGEANLSGTLSGANNLISTNANLAVLGNYGGPTPTMPPLTGSAAIDTGSDAFVSVLATDQRGYVRQVGVHADIGAVEVQGTNGTAMTLSAAVSNSVATLNGSVTSGGYSTATWFEWGASSYSNTTTVASVVIGAGVASSNVSAVVSVAPGLIYYCRIVASNALGVVRGNYVSFGSPSVALNDSATVTNECHAAFTDTFTNPITATGLPLMIVGGGSHNLALRSDRTLAAWGNSANGRTNVPSGLSNMVAVAAGFAHSLAVKNDGTVVAWGNNTSQETNVPVTLSNVVAVSAGYNHSMALKSNGTVIVWGDNGNSSTTNSPASLTNAMAIGAGQWSSVALKSNGIVVAWGDNGYNQTNVPTSLSNVVAIAAGNFHNLALKSDGSVVAWGAGTNNSGLSYNYGQSVVPAGATNVIAIEAGDFCSAALKSDGTVIVWGDNSFSQTNVPAGLSNVVAFTMGNVHCLATKADGTFVGWGLPSQGITTVPATATNLALTVTTGGTFNTNNSPGSYLLTYIATNSLGGTGTVSRTVVVQDKTPPVITLVGNNPLTNFLNAPLSDPGATASDACGGSFVVTSNSNVNVGVLGTYTITYTSSDNYSNSTNLSRTVLVVGVPTYSGFTATVIGTNAANGSRTVQFTAGVNPNGLNSTVNFQFGLTSAYAGTNGPVSVSGSFNAGNVTVTVPGFSSDVAYHWNVTGTNIAGSSSSPDQTFTIGTLPGSGIPGDINGDGIVSQAELDAVYGHYVTNSPWLYMTNVAGLGETNVSFGLSNSVSGAYTVQASTNLIDWTTVGPASPRYLFSDTNTPANSQRYYRLIYP